MFISLKRITIKKNNYNIFKNNKLIMDNIFYLFYIL